jgi:hypothetical protein
MMGCIKLIAFLAGLAMTLTIYLKFYLKRVAIPEHLLNHPIIYEHNLIEPETAKGLNKIVREMGMDEVGYPT